MRVAAEEHRFADALRKEVVLTLRDDAHQARQILPRPHRCRTASNAGTAHEGRQRTQGESHERGFAAPIGAKHRVEFAQADRQRHVSQRVVRGPRVAIANVLEPEHHDFPRIAHAVHAIVQRRSRNANTGTPISAVTTPTGSSRGATTVRASVSANASSAPPPRKAAGSKARCRWPQVSRAMCGPTSPTNPMTPETATAAAVRRDAAR